MVMTVMVGHDYFNNDVNCIDINGLLFTLPVWTLRIVNMSEPMHKSSKQRHLSITQTYADTGRYWIYFHIYV